MSFCLVPELLSSLSLLTLFQHQNVTHHPEPTKSDDPKLTICASRQVPFNAVSSSNHQNNIQPTHLYLPLTTHNPTHQHPSQTDHPPSHNRPTPYYPLTPPNHPPGPNPNLNPNPNPNPDPVAPPPNPLAMHQMRPHLAPRRHPSLPLQRLRRLPVPRPYRRMGLRPGPLARVPQPMAGGRVRGRARRGRSRREEERVAVADDAVQVQMKIKN